MRLTQAVLGISRSRIACYVDDPLVTLAGSQEQRRLHASLVIALWSSIGLPLATHKLQFAQEVVWTSARLKFTGTALEVMPKPELVSEVTSLISDCLARNLVPKVKLRRLTGKLMHIASLIATLRPFIQPLWGA
eukprot:6459572-Amphidinium_carterae.1